MSDKSSRLRPRDVTKHPLQAAGPIRLGAVRQMLNQICTAGLVQGPAEGIYFEKKAGLDIEARIANS